MKYIISYNDLYRYLEILIIYSCLFPYVSFGLNSMDSQPWALLLSMIYILSKMRFESHNIFYLWMITVLIMILSILYILHDNIIRIGTEEHSFIFLIRAISNYSIVFFVWSISITIHKKYNPVHHYIIASILYISNGIMQTYGIWVLDWMSNNRSSRYRGVTSFAAEPTYFGLILFFLSWLIFNGITKIKVKDRKSKIIVFLGYITIILNIFSILFIAKSATATLLVLTTLLICLFLFLNKKIFYYSVFSITFLSIFIYLNYKPTILFKYGLERSRPVEIVKMVSESFSVSSYNSIIEIAYNDESINSRLSQIAMPFYGIVYNYGMPGGYFTFDQIYTQVIGPNSFFHSEYGLTFKIQSFIGVFVYELGFIGILVLIFAAILLKKENNWKWREIIILFISLLPSVPLGMGMVPLLLGSKIKSFYINNQNK